MEIPAVRRLQIIGLVSLWILYIALPGAVASYSIGVGRADTTGPTAEVIFVSIFSQTTYYDLNPINRSGLEGKCTITAKKYRL